MGNKCCLVGCSNLSWQGVSDYCEPHRLRLDIDKLREDLAATELTSKAMAKTGMELMAQLSIAREGLEAINNTGACYASQLKLIAAQTLERMKGE